MNWSVIRKEVAAILMAVGQNAYFLAGARKITVYCDSKAVSFLRGTKQSTPILWRFAQVISQFDLEVVHIKGEDNFLADYLSRSIFPADMPSNFTPMSEATMSTLLDQIHIPVGAKMDTDMVRSFLLDDGLPEVAPKRLRKPSVSKVRLTPATTKPKVKQERDIKCPPLKRTNVPHEHLEEHSQFFRKDPSAMPNSKACPKNVAQRFMTADNHRTEDDFQEAELNELVLMYQEHTTDEKQTTPALSQESVPPTPPSKPGPSAERLRLHHRILRDSLISTDALRHAQSTDDLFGEYLIGKKDLPKHWIIHDNILHYQNDDTYKVMLPTNLFWILFTAKHLSLWCKHAPPSTLFNELTKTYFHPNLMDMISDATAQCTVCSISKKGNLPSYT